MIKEQHQNFHVGLKAFIDKDKSLLIVRESKKYKSGGKWELPGGRINKDEINQTLEKILERELSEELGWSLKVKIGKLFSVWRRMTHPDAKVFLVGFNCIYKNGNIKLSSEHINYVWIKAKEINKYKFADGYKEQIIKYFKK